MLSISPLPLIAQLERRKAGGGCWSVVGWLLAVCYVGGPVPGVGLREERVYQSPPPGCSCSTYSQLCRKIKQVSLIDQIHHSLSHCTVSVISVSRHPIGGELARSQLSANRRARHWEHDFIISHWGACRARLSQVYKTKVSGGAQHQDQTLGTDTSRQEESSSEICEERKESSDHLLWSHFS